MCIKDINYTTLGSLKIVFSYKMLHLVPFSCLYECSFIAFGTCWTPTHVLPDFCAPSYECICDTSKCRRNYACLWVYLSSTVSDGKQAVSGEIAAPCGKVFIIKCDFLHPHQTTGKRIRQAIFCSCCSAFHLFPSFFTGLREKYADFELGGLAINWFKMLINSTGNFLHVKLLIWIYSTVEWSAGWIRMSSSNDWKDWNKWPFADRAEFWVHVRAASQ